MLNVIIEEEGVPSSTKVKEILEDRQALVEFTKDRVDAGDRRTNPLISETCFLCSKKYFNAIKGQSGLIEKAKSYKANSIIVISQTANAFSVREDLGGKLLHINFPQETKCEDTLSEYGIQMIATLITRNNQFIAGLF